MPLEPRRSFWSGKPVCVTGGTGFLGYHLVRQLLDLGARVRVLALPPARKHPLLDRPEVTPVFGNLLDAEFVRRALAGCRAVFHTAGLVAVWGPALKRMRAVHVAGTQNVLAGAPTDCRVVHTSSIVAVGATPDRAALDEDSPFTLHDLAVDYVHAKRAAEEVALTAARDVVVCNPGYLVGPEDHGRSVMGRFCVRFWKGRMLLSPPGGFNLVDVRDVARGHLLAAEHGQAGRRYILGGENHTFWEFMKLLCAAAGLKPRAVPRLPSWALTGMAGLAEGLARVTGKEPYPSFQQVRMGRYYWFVRSDRAVREIGYRARPLEACLADTYRWYMSNRRMPLRGFNRWWMRPDRRLGRAA